MAHDQLLNFYDELKTKNTENLYNTNINDRKPIQGSNINIWKSKAINQAEDLRNDVHKKILVNTYDKILPLDNDYKKGHRAQMVDDIENMLADKGMSATQYFRSAYEKTKAPLLEFVLRAGDNIANKYLKEAKEELTDAQENELDIPDPEAPSTDDPEVDDQIVEVEGDMEYETFVDELKKKTIDKIVDDISSIINDEKEESDMTFDPNPEAPMEESVLITSMDYLMEKLINENIEINKNIHDKMLGLSIREATLAQFDKVFKMNTNRNINESVSKIKYHKGILVNKNTKII